MDLEEIKKAMHTLACGDTSFETVSRLAALQIVYDHLSTSSEPNPAAAPRTAKSKFSGSEFLDAISAAPLEDVMLIMDEHMEALRVVIPAEYDAIMRKLRDL